MPRKSRPEKRNEIARASASLFDGRYGLIYARVSSKRQEVEGSGLQSQESRCKKDLESIGVPYEETFSDSFSGGGDFLNRPAMRAMLDYIDKNAHKKFVVVFDDLKRFARDTVFHLKLRAAFKARDVTLRCLNYNFDDSEEGYFVETVLAAGAELERHQNRRQVMQKQRARLESGYWAFGSKKGYTMTDDPIHGTISIPNKIGLEILKPALEGFANGSLTRKIDVCKFLVEKGFWKKQSPEKYIDKLTLILIDPFYAGYIEYMKPGWEVTRRKGKHDGIISLEAFEAIQKRLKNEGLNRRIRKDISDDFEHRGLVACAHCGEHLTASFSKSTYAYYFCQNKACDLYKKSIRRKDIADGFTTVLKKTQLKADVSKVVKVIFDRTWKQEIRALEAQEASIGRHIDELQGKVRQLTGMASGAKTDRLREAYETQIEEVMAELEQIDTEPIAKIDYSIPYQTALDKATGFLKSPYKIWQNFGIREKHELFFFVYEAKLPYERNQGYQTEKIQSYVRLFEEFATANTHDVEMPGIEPIFKDKAPLQQVRRTGFEPLLGIPTPFPTAGIPPDSRSPFVYRGLLGVLSPGDTPDFRWF